MSVTGDVRGVKVEFEEYHPAPYDSWYEYMPILLRRGYRSTVRT
jgi:hypothetical protein